MEVGRVAGTVMIDVWKLDFDVGLPCPCHRCELRVLYPEAFERETLIENGFTQRLATSHDADGFVW